MTASPASVSVLALTGCLAGASLLFVLLAARPVFAQAARALGQPAHKAGAAVATVAAVAADSDSLPFFAFDIQAQPLAAALDRYAVITGNPVLFPSKLAAGRNSAAVSGRHDAATALAMLLQGSGLVAEALHEGDLDTFVLKPQPLLDSAAAALDPARLDADRSTLERYDALVQARVWEALCSNTRTAPGRYRALLRLRVDGDGRVYQPRLLSSTGDARRDAMLTGLLDRLSVGEPPPAGLSQPLTMLMLPQEQIAGRPCRAEGR